MALDLKIKDIVKWKLESFEQKQKLKDEKVMHIEINQNRLEQNLKEALIQVSQSTESDIDVLRSLVGELKDRIEQNEMSFGLIAE